MSLSNKNLNDLKTKILEEKSRVMNGLNVGVSKFFEDTDKVSDETDVAVNEYERSQSLRLRNRDLLYLKKLNLSLEKFESNEYGICSDCGGDISYPRLKARPTAELCITCKDENEKEEFQNVFQRKSKSLSDEVHLF